MEPSNAQYTSPPPIHPAPITTGSASTPSPPKPIQPITVPAPPLSPSSGADLMIFDAPQLSKNTLKSGETLSVNTRVWNRGRIPSPQTTLRYYLSTDETLSLDDTEVANDAVPPLSGRSAHPSRRRADLSKTLTAPETSGTHYYIVCVDATPG